MKRILVAAVMAAIPALQLHAQNGQPVQAPKPVASHAPTAPVFGAAEQSALVKQYCTGCHNDRAKAGQLSLAAFDAAAAANPDHVITTEKMIRKLRAGMMPPANARRPEPDQIRSLVSALESRIDRAALVSPNPGSRPFQRLNRAEYGRAVKDMLDIDIDVAGLLPPDSISNGFDNVADAQSFSATLMESYLRAAAKVTALAIGDKEAAATETNYRVPKTASQLSRVDGAPFGTRGGISVPHTFPADGDYVFKVELHSNACGVLFGGPNQGEEVEISVDGERKAIIKIDPKMAEAHYWLGMANLNLGKIPEAKVAFNEYLKLAPTGQYAATTKAILDTIK